jgi:hypothetical protein
VVNAFVARAGAAGKGHQAGGIRRWLIDETSIPAPMPLLMRRNGGPPLSMPIVLGIQVLDDYGRAP